MSKRITSASIYDESGESGGGGESILEFADLAELYSASPDDGQLCRVAWEGDDHVNDGEILTRWNGVEFLPDPLYQGEMPGWIFGEGWEVPPNQDLVGGVLDYVDGRPRISCPSNPSTIGFFMALGPSFTERGHGGVRCRFRIQNCNIGGATFHRSGCGLAPPDIEPAIAVAGSYNDFATCGRVGNTAGNLFVGYNNTQTAVFATGGSCPTDDENWICTVEIVNMTTAPAASLSLSSRVVATSSTETFGDSNVVGGIVNQNHGNSLHGQRIALRPCLAHGVFGSGTGAVTYRLTLLGIQLLPPKLDFASTDYTE